MQQAESSSHFIDCDADPLIPQGLRVKEHRRGGKLLWNQDNISLYLSARQRSGLFIEGFNLYNELTSLPVLNINVLNYLLSHAELIPSSWKGKCVFFWGTIFYNKDGEMFVCGLDWDYSGRKWICLCNSLEDCCDRACPAAVAKT